MSRQKQVRPKDKKPALGTKSRNEAGYSAIRRGDCGMCLGTCSCATCDGTGRDEDEECFDCDGDGRCGDCGGVGTRAAQKKIFAMRGEEP